MKPRYILSFVLIALGVTIFNQGMEHYLNEKNAFLTQLFDLETHPNWAMLWGGVLLALGVGIGIVGKRHAS
jgi:uncharacterized membrane protein